MRRTNAMAAGLVMAFCSAGAATAQTDDEVQRQLSPTYHRCMATGDAALGTTYGILDCVRVELRRQDAELNRTYRDEMAKLTGSARTRLRNAERRWIVRRDEGCRRQAAGEEGGSLGRIIEAQCHLTETTRQVLWLRRR